MRVAVLVEQLLQPVPGGTGRYARELAAGLATSFQVTGWTAFHRSADAAVIPGVAGPRRLPLGRRPLSLAWQRDLGPAPRGADVVVAPTLLVPPRRGRPLLVVVHDAVPWTHPETLTPHGVAFHRAIGERVAREADAVCVPTQATADELLRVLPGLDGRLHTVGAGVSPAVGTPPDDAAARAARLGLPPAYVLAVGSLEPRKGLDVLVAAMASVPGLPLLVAGPPGWGDVDLAATAAAAGLSPDRVRALGRLDDPDLATVFARATVLAAPSRSEGFGLPVAEAMAAGIPVVCSDVPAHAEVGGDSVRLVPVGDAAALAAALNEVASDSELRAGMVARGRERARHLTWPEVSRRVTEIVLGIG